MYHRYEIRSKMHEIRTTAWIALGGNLPRGAEKPERTLSEAIEMIASRDIQICSISKFYRTPCFPKGGGPDYVNAAMSVKTTLSAGALLTELHHVETHFSRVREERWGGRTLDLDLLSFGNAILPNLDKYAKWRDLDLQTQIKSAPDELILPHPRLQDRSFVLIPLCDIGADWSHPVSGETALNLRDRLSSEDISSVEAL
ncbi:2-amino-4-hydroxy-6-hydroxymethyldihydropteridine diphosphokinase [Epibacterium ulvae]|nr:2-amino-4-hydroxy-6-hydroxymethyldihydropteridine diphosphokinase [Epibacterium ulvae]